jgi:hypothetical protein
MPNLARKITIGIAILLPSAALASSVDDAARIQAKAMGFRYQLRKSAGGRPLSAKEQEMDKKLGAIVQGAARKGFMENNRKLKDRIERANDEQIRQFKAELQDEQVRAEIQSKDPDHKQRDKIRAASKGGKIPTSDGSGPGLGTGGNQAALTPAPVSGGSTSSGSSRPKTVLDGSRVPKELEFAPQKKPAGQELEAGPDGIYTPKAKKRP